MRSRFLTLSVLLTALVLVSCTKTDTKDTIILLGDESYYKENVYQQIINAIPSDINISEILPEIPDGCVPPNIEGDYCVDPNWKTYHNNIPVEPGVASNCYVHFGEQHNAISNMAIVQGDSINYPQYISPLYSDTIFIKGYNDRFTAFYIVDHIDKQNNNIIYHKGVLITGIIGELNGVRGIRNFHRIEVIIDSDDELGLAIPNGTIISYYDTDNISKRCHWYKDGMFN